MNFINPVLEMRAEQKKGKRKKKQQNTGINLKNENVQLFNVILEWIAIMKASKVAKMTVQKIDFELFSNSFCTKINDSIWTVCFQKAIATVSDNY